MQEQIVNFYSQPQVGMGMPVFAGARRPGGMVGGGFFSTLARFAVPLLKNIGGRALRVAARTATDVLDRQQPWKQSLVNNTLDEVKTFVLPSSSSGINKEGAGIRRKRHHLNDIFSSSSKRIKRIRRK